ncbi:PP2C family serine/threonine-protein phosphatase [Acetobacter oeni]|uniref:PPM-type phosphatase domain-containing protein n=1 Tax=Acetobacter oeni TaxID=304077 RepID=A0A511XMP3_9PROT|nr:PP2C family serine/threonine-protein phosphatase [Acetobacter oeni]MBB3884139.1 hypothetical protein [Acetobacter oeni]NHO20141.1 protein phosphatase 2C domain-containing protein [Acetobacter oeni]GBR04357.1 serine/threonine phosphoprotein phosphatase [Acetobacter oeni LMG 21952]GEN64215.1 hypothetical protein AOE01nite_24390 [Acetobacter oeni]
MAWRKGAACVIGTSHLRKSLPCQDSAACLCCEDRDGRAYLVATVSDGAGTAAEAEAGATTATRVFIDYAKQRIGQASAFVADEAFWSEVMTNIRDAIEDHAVLNELSVADYACTFIGCVIGPERSGFAQVGDGAIVVREGDGLVPVFWPQHGEFANQTFFVTEPDAMENLQVCGRGRVDELALFSDGIERLVLDFTEERVHEPAFRSIFQWLRGREAGSDEAVAGVLEAWLGSEQVNGRTDDDKSLIIATRLMPDGV